MCVFLCVGVWYGVSTSKNYCNLKMCIEYLLKIVTAWSKDFYLSLYLKTQALSKHSINVYEIN